MHKFLIVAAALAAAACGPATAQNDQPPAQAQSEHQGGGGGRRMLEAADANHDGSISRAEFNAAHAARFAEMDANHDGSLSQDERPQWGGRRGGGDASATPAANRPNRGDANGDGVISRAEYDAQGAQQFDRMDANHDGNITQDEMQAMRDRRRDNQN